MPPVRGHQVENGHRDTGTKKWSCTFQNGACHCIHCKGNWVARCHHTYKNKSDMLTHHQSHHDLVPAGGLQPTRCETCGVVIKDPRNLARHMKQKHAAGSNSRSDLQCPHTGCQYRNRSDNLRRHLMRVHQFDKSQANGLVASVRGHQNGGAPASAPPPPAAAPATARPPASSGVSSDTTPLPLLEGSSLELTSPELTSSAASGNDSSAAELSSFVSTPSPFEMGVDLSSLLAFNQGQLPEIDHQDWLQQPQFLMTEDNLPTQQSAGGYFELNPGAQEEDLRAAALQQPAIAEQPYMGNSTHGDQQFLTSWELGPTQPPVPFVNMSQLRLRG